jgi:hypothetical protein
MQTSSSAAAPPRTAAADDPPAASSSTASSSAAQSELVHQYEEQIHAAQLEREKRKLQIADLRQALAERSRARQATLARRAAALPASPAAEAEDSPHAEGRVRRDLSLADRRLVRNVLLRELGGEGYVPPNLKNNTAGVGGAGYGSSTRPKTHPRVIIRCGDRAHREISYHAAPGYRFRDLLKDVCNFFGVPMDEFQLRDSNGVHWGEAQDICSVFSREFANNAPPTLYLVYRSKLDVGGIYFWKHPKPFYETEADIAIRSAQEQSHERLNGTASQQVPPRIQRVVRQLGSTLLIIVLMSVALLLRRNVQSMYFMSRSVRANLVEQAFGQYMEKNFLKIASAKDVYEWLEGPLVESVQPDYAGDAQRIIDRSFRQVGAVRLRQMRVRKDATCSLSSEMAMWEQKRSRDDADAPLVTFVDGCYGGYWEDTPYVETDAYGPAVAFFGIGATTTGDTANDDINVAEGFVYNSPTNTTDLRSISTYRNSLNQKLQSWWILGDFALYGPGGYIVEFAPGSSAVAMRKRIQALRKHGWIDQQTRAIIVAVNLYNGNYNYYVSAQLRLEFGTSGAILAKEKLISFSLDVFDMAGSTSALAGEVLLLIMAGVIFGVVAEHVLTASRRGWVAHCTDFYNMLSFTAYALYFVSQMLRVGLFADPSRVALVDGVSIKRTEYVELAKWGEIISFIDGLEAIALILMWGTLLQCYAIFPSPHSILLTVSRAGPVFIAFLTFFFCIVIGFALLANNVLGMYVPAFRTFLGTVSTLLQTASGEVDLRGAQELAPMSAYAYLVLFGYTIVVKLVVLNCAIAIITFVYSRTMGARQKQLLKEEVEGAPSQYYNLTLMQFVELLSRGLIRAPNARNALLVISKKSKEG